MLEWNGANAAYGLSQGGRSLASPRREWHRDCVTQRSGAPSPDVLLVLGATSSTGEKAGSRVRFLFPYAALFLRQQLAKN